MNVTNKEIDEIQKDGFREGPEEIWSEEDFFVSTPKEMNPVFNQAKAYNAYKAHIKKVMNMKKAVRPTHDGQFVHIVHARLDGEDAKLKEIQAILRGEK